VSASAVVLAAGKGDRLGGAKALLRIGPVTLLEHVLRRLVAAGFSPVVAVVNADVFSKLEATFRVPESARLVINPEGEKGPLHSLHLGLDKLGDAADGVLVAPVDHPFVSDKTLRMMRLGARRDRILIPTYQGRRGHPPLFGSDLLPILRRIPLEEGARGAYRQVPDSIREIETEDAGVLLNANTHEDWQRGLDLLRLKS